MDEQLRKMAVAEALAIYRETAAQCVALTADSDTRRTIFLGAVKIWLATKKL
jgi:hypothetical protein